MIAATGSLTCWNAVEHHNKQRRLRLTAVPDCRSRGVAALGLSPRQDAILAFPPIGFRDWAIRRVERKRAHV